MLTKTEKKVNRKTKRLNLKLKKLMFHEIESTRDCLSNIISWFIETSSIEDIQNILCVSKLWKSEALKYTKRMKDIRIISDYFCAIYKGYIQENVSPFGVYSYRVKLKIWSRLTYVPASMNTYLIYKDLGEHPTAVWRYSSRKIMPSNTCEIDYM